MNDLKFDYCAAALNLAERQAVSAALLRITFQEKYHKQGVGSPYFWGKIFGQRRDYLIISAVELTQSLHRKYYVSSDNGIAFSQLPLIDDFIVKRVEELSAIPLVGDGAYIYPSGDDRVLTELERLAGMISIIDSATTIVPRLSLIRESNSIITRAADFQHISAAFITDLKNILHFRAPILPSTIARAEANSFGPIANFLDSIDSDVPKGLWSIIVDPSSTHAHIRNLQFPGFEFHIDLLSGSYSQAYFGDGMTTLALVHQL